MTSPVFLSLLIANLLSSTIALATVKVTAVSGASAVDLTASPVQIFGGLAGDVSLCPSGGTSAGCNTCVEGERFACNTNRVYADRRLVITFQSDTVTDPASLIPFITTTAGTEITSAKVNASGKDSPGSVSLDWSEICKDTSGAAGGINDLGPDCEDGYQFSNDYYVGFGTSASSITEKIQIKIRLHNPDPTLSGTEHGELGLCGDDDTGICKFEAYPGDGKIFLESPEPNSGFPNVTNVKVKYLRIFYSTSSLDDILDTSSYKDIELSTSTSTSAVETLSNQVDGLENDTTYYFRLASVDEALNVMDYTGDLQIEDECGPIAGLDADDDVACPYIATPSEVYGLLPKQFNCFIASAAYGSPFEKHVDLFREFRAKVLLKSKLGKKFVRFYNKYGPYPAAFIMKHPEYRPLARVILWPAWVFVYVSLKWSLVLATLVLFSPLALAVSYARISRKKSNAKTAAH